MVKKNTDNISDVFYHYLLHNVDSVIGWVTIIAEAIHQAFHLKAEISVRSDAL